MDKLHKWALAIQSHEGYYKGSRSYRNKNPGNLKFCGQRLATGQDANNFAIFKTYEDGFMTLVNQLRYACIGKSAVYSPNDTLYSFFQKFAPATDNNNPKIYAEVVAHNLMVDPNISIKKLIL